MARQKPGSLLRSAIVCGFLLTTSSLTHLAWSTAADDPQSEGLSEIVVTAEKYNSTIQNTPISMSALSGEQIAAAGIDNVEGLVHEIPGISMRSAGPDQTEYEARGLASNGGAAPTVGFYLDEVPLSPPALAQNGKVVIDPNLYDINRIEVLRGPQGTLYGSGSMGGTVKVITTSRNWVLSRVLTKERCRTRKAAMGMAAVTSWSIFQSVTKLP
jgi:iron complex outermembrane receptor protein